MSIEQTEQRDDILATELTPEDLSFDFDSVISEALGAKPDREDTKTEPTDDPPDPDEDPLADPEGEEEDPGDEPDETPESEPEPETPEPPKPSRDAETEARLERLAAQERQLSERRREIDQIRAEADQQVRQAQQTMAEAQRLTDLMDRIKSGDPLEALKAFDIEPEAFVRAVVEKRGVNPNHKLEKRQAELEAKIRQQEEAVEQARRADEHARAVAQARGSIGEMLAQRSPVLSALGEEGISLVYDMAQQARQRGEVARTDTILEKAHKDVFSLLDRLAAIPEVRTHLGLGTTDSGSKQTPPRAASRTVSNRVVTTPAPKKQDKIDKLTADPGDLFDALFGQ